VVRASELRSEHRGCVHFQCDYLRSCRETSLRGLPEEREPLKLAMAEVEGTKLQSGAGAVDTRLFRVAAKLFQEKSGKKKGREKYCVSLAPLLGFMCLRPIRVCITCSTLFNKDTLGCSAFGGKSILLSGSYEIVPREPSP